MEGIGGRRIAKELNYTLQVKAPLGGLWTSAQVDAIATNPIYCGPGVAGVSSSAAFYQRGKAGAEKVEVDATILATRKYLPVRWRPVKDWTWKDQPYLEGFLPEPLRSIAAERCREAKERRCDPDKKPRHKNGHPDSLYSLTNLLRAARDGRLLKGQNSGPKGKPFVITHTLSQGRMRYSQDFRTLHFVRMFSRRQFSIVCRRCYRHHPIFKPRFNQLSKRH